MDFATTNQDGYFTFHFYFTYPGNLAANQLADFIRVYLPHYSAAAFYGDNAHPLSDYFAAYADFDIRGVPPV
jgi:hypothetical protein